MHRRGVPGLRRATSPSLLLPPLPRPARTSPLPPHLAERARLSADLLAALMEVENLDHPSLDDIEWADAVADRILSRRAARRAA